MALVLVMGSHVAGSRVGGTVVSLALALGPGAVEPVHVPTTLLGRHPGWGPPGGGAVDPGLMAGMVEGLAGNHLLEVLDAVITGYASHPDQVAVMADTIDRARAANPDILVLVDPVMGDDGRRYVAEGVAEAVAQQLVPRADVLTPNVTELAMLCPGCETGTAAACLAAARSLGRRVLVTSVPVEREGAMAALWVDPARPVTAALLVHPVHAGARVVRGIWRRPVCCPGWSADWTALQRRAAPLPWWRKWYGARYCGRQLSCRWWQRAMP